jgi:hypothetical protein
MRLITGLDDGDPEGGPCPGCRCADASAGDGARRRLWVPRPLTMHAGPAAPCGKPGNPKCGDPKKRAAGLSKIAKDVDALALTFGSMRTLLDMTGKMTILDATVATSNRQRLEHAAGILIDSNGVPRFTKVVYGDLDSVDGLAPAINKELKSGDKLVGVIHSHPGGEGGQHFSEGDITAAKNFEKDRVNQKLFHPQVWAQFYLLTPKTLGGKVLVYDVKRDTVTVVG